MAEENEKQSGLSDKAILAEAKERLKQCIDDEDTERDKMKDDLRFATLDQWPEVVRNAREKDPNGARPCLTADTCNQYIGQVVNDMRQNRPAIKVRPVDSGADVQTAKIMQGVIRHIEDRSNADVAYETAGESITRVGLGYWRVVTEIRPGTFNEQEIFIRAIQDCFSVYLGPHIIPDGSDCEFGFVLENMPKEKFKRLYPKAKCEVSDFDGMTDKPTWVTNETVMVCEYFYKEFSDADLLFLDDGTTMTKAEYEKTDDQRTIQDSRKTQDEKVKWCKLTGAEILEKRDWAGKYIPIVEVVGKESHVDGKRVLWGLVRPVKDMLRMKNYWLSAATERMALAPKAPFVGAKGQFEGVEEMWKKANVENRAYLEYNPIDVQGNALPRPERVAPAPTEVAMVQMIEMINHEAQSALGMFRAAVGESQGQQSGRALLALERSSDTGTMHFPDNLARGIRFCGQIIVDLFPKITDTRRVLRILGEDGETQSAVHDPAQPQAVTQNKQMDGSIQTIYNLDAGEYDVTVTVGPSYNTKRMEAATTFAELAKGAADPVSAAIMRYLTVKNSDFTSSEEAVKMLKSVLPPPVLQAIADPNAQMPPQAQAMIQQLHGQMQQMQQQGQELQAENVKLKSGEAPKMAAVQVDAQKGQAELQLKAQTHAQDSQLEQAKIQAQIALEREKASAQIELEKAKAAAQIELEHVKMQAQCALDQAKMQGDQACQAQKLQFDMQCRAEDQKAKAEEKTEKDAVSAMPNIVKMMDQMMKQHDEFNKALIAELKKPKKVTLGGIKRDGGGDISGASATVN